MRKFIKKYKSWSLPSKMTLWGLLFGIITTPSAIIGYFQFFGNDDISDKLYRALQVNSRAYLKIKNVDIANYYDEGKVLVLNIENISNFMARNIKTKVSLSNGSIILGHFNNKVLSRSDIGIPPQTTSNIAVIPMTQLVESINKVYPNFDLLDITLLDRVSENHGKEYPFGVIVSHKTDGREDISQVVALKAILRLREKV